MTYTRLALLSLTLVVAGCPNSSSIDTGTLGMDTPTGMDTPGADVPGTDVPGADTPGLDVPGLDVPGADVPGADTPGADVPGTDSPTTTACSGLPAAACMMALCVPSFDDTCCRDCPPPGPCADCTNPDYIGCRALADSACRTGCGSAPDWVCNDVLPSCEGAAVVDVDSCSRVGCVPRYPAGTGAPDLGTARCVPIAATSCTVMCRRAPPPCPDGTFPEGDGFCYTDFCVPNFVCR